MRLQQHVACLSFFISFWVVFIHGIETISDTAQLTMYTAMLKMSQSNPVIPVRIDGVPTNLILTTDIDDILICGDLNLNSVATLTKHIEFDYARKLLRLQLSGLPVVFNTALLDIASFNVSAEVFVGTFYLKQGWYNLTTLEFFLRLSGAVGFIGVGYAYKLQSSVFWGMLETQGQSQYLYNATTFSWPLINNTTNNTMVKSDKGAILLPHNFDEDTDTWDWSEPASSVNEVHYDGKGESINNQGILLMIHNAHFQCTTPSTQTIRQVDMFGEFTGNWDAFIDWNSPCLVLPREFYDSLAGWIGLVYNDVIKLSQFESNTSMSTLPTISFSLHHNGAIHDIPLSKLVMPSSNNNTTRSFCIQPSVSIRQDGRAVFASITSDEASSLQYRMSGPMRDVTLYNMFHSPIIFGHMVLAAMGPMIVNGETKQIAWSRRRTDTLETTTAVCQPIVECKGSQTFIARENSCQDPNCAAYYFQTFNPVTKECSIEPNWYTFLFTSVVVLITAELLVSFQTRRMIQPYSTTNAVSDLVNTNVNSID